MLVVLVCLCLTDDGRRRRRRGHSEKGIGNGARLTRDKHLGRNMTYERLPWCPPSRRGLSLRRHGDQIPRWDHLGSAASRSPICLAKSWNVITVGGVVKNSPKDTNSSGVPPIPSGCYNPDSRSVPPRSLVHSASPMVEREEDPTVRAPEGAEEQPLRWTDGRTDDAAVASLMM